MRVDRSEVPWWGVERLRWGVNGGWSRYKSSPVAGTSNDSLVITNDWRVLEVLLIASALLDESGRPIAVAISSTFWAA